MFAESIVSVQEDGARKWFLALSEHPENYRFASHLGFYITEGNFGEVGSRFYTKERFHGFMLKLSFRLTEVSANRFTFTLLKPISNIDGTFTITKVDTSQTRITLCLSSSHKFICQLFKIRPFYRAVQMQITSELQHIKTSMEYT